MTAPAQLLARVGAAMTERVRAEAALSERFAPRFNPIMLLAPGETRLSAVFRWLLDEAESHGQRSLFRDRFVTDLLRDDAARWNGARLVCEISTIDGGRIDLLMTTTDGTRAVVIENKPWAGWQPEQVARYFADQRERRSEVQLLALLGDADPDGALARHWAEWTTEPLPECARAIGYAAVATWLEDCAAMVRADNVRCFLYDLAHYCRRSILSEPEATEVDHTADIILAGGAEALEASRLIAAAVPLALTREVARLAGGAVERVGSQYAVSLAVDGVPVHFVLFGTANPWAGARDAVQAENLRGTVEWCRPERLWPRWAYVKQVGANGAELARAALSGDTARAADLAFDVARTLIGPRLS